jgi:hypothetical protein
MVSRNAKIMFSKGDTGPVTYKNIRILIKCDTRVTNNYYIVFYKCSTDTDLICRI